MNEIEQILNELNPEERAAVLQILKEQASAGSSNSLQQLYEADYDELPVDIDTFLESPHYLGKSTDGGKAIYPYWRNAYREIIEQDKVECALGGSIGCGKAAKLDSLLVGPEGYFKMGDVKLGDKVAGQDGKFYSVTGIWPQGKQPIYRITFSDHTYVECSLDHLWNIRRTDRPSRHQTYPNPSYVYETKSVRWLLQQDLKIGRGRVDKKGHKLEQNKFAIPVTLPVQFNTKHELPIHPYLLGNLLADGGLSGGGIQTSIYEEDIRDRVSELCEIHGCELILQSESDTHPGLGEFSIRGITKGKNEIRNAVKKLGINVKSVKKHIPKVCLLSTVENRLELLRGMFDGDGYMDSGRYMYSTSSKQLYEDFCFLVYSLGGVVNVTEGKRAFQVLKDGSRIYSDYDNWEFTFKLPKALKPFSSKKHRIRYGKGTSFHEMEYRFIESIEYVGEHECQCITVDNPESLYLMDNFTVTHNTTAAVYLMSYFVYKLMCLKNIRQYYGLEGNGPISVCFLNNTIKLSQGVAYDKFMSTLATSPWFLERGEVRGTVNIRYKPDKNIDFIVGSSADQIIGRDIFCLTGDTKIPTEYGLLELKEIADKSVRVYAYNEKTGIYLTEEPCKIVCTKFVDTLVHITLQNHEIVRCTPNHKFMMESGHFEEAGNLMPGDVLKCTGNKNGTIIQDVMICKYSNKEPVFDVLDVPEDHCFAVDVCNGEMSVCEDHSIGCIISHNCAILDEVNFNKGSDVQFEKNKVLETYNACYGRIKNRFTVNGKCQGRIFLISSKKTEYDFLNQYIDKKMQSPEDSKHLFVADAKAFEVKPKGSYSGKMFRVAVGGSNLESKIPTDEETTEELIHQGYEVYDVPVELRGDFELDINRFIADHLGISVSEVIKFIPYSKLEQCYKDIKNPFTQEVFEANLDDDVPIKNHFIPNVVTEAIYSKPIFIHLDTSGGKKDNTGISAIAAMGFVNRNRYSESSGQEETTKQMLYRHVFSVGLNARKGSEISYQKIVDFLWYLKFDLGWNIKAVSTDGYMGQFLRQQITASLGGEVNYVSLDRTPDGYLAFQSILSEMRIALIKLHLLESEVVRLERNNVTGKVDHPPIDGCFVGDTLIYTEDGNISIDCLVEDYRNGISHNVMTFNENAHKFELKPIKKAFLTKYVNRVVTVTLADGDSFTCTPEHRIMLDDGTYIRAQELNNTMLSKRCVKVMPSMDCLSARLVKNITMYNYKEPVPVYDLEIEDNHNFALACGVIVHNSKDIADSLAGALYNASLHEASIDFGNSELIDTIVDFNKAKPRVTKPHMKLVDELDSPNPSNKDIETPSISNVSQDFEKQWRMRQELQYSIPDNAEEEKWDPRDMIIDI